MEEIHEQRHYEKKERTFEVYLYAGALMRLVLNAMVDMYGGVAGLLNNAERSKLYVAQENLLAVRDSLDEMFREDLPKKYDRNAFHGARRTHARSKADRRTLEMMRDILSYWLDEIDTKATDNNERRQ